MKSHCGMGVLLQICCIFSEHLFLKWPLDGCFWKNVLRTLPSLHDFSECESTSAFHGTGKRKWLNIVKGNEEYCKELCLQIEDHVFEMIESMFCKFYGFFKKPNVSDVWYGKWCAEIFLKLVNSNNQRRVTSTC